MKTRRFVNMIVSLVGKVLLFDGSNIDFQCADGLPVKVSCEPDSQVQQGSIYEFVGLANEDGSLQVSEGMVKLLFTLVSRGEMVKDPMLECFTNISFCLSHFQLFVSRELSVDMDLEIYNRMIMEIQHNPKYAENFFSSISV